MNEVTNHRKKRSLILAGGGMKVAFQAGVLQVWLDEARVGGAPLTFDHADGARAEPSTSRCIARV